jgi:SAM-dependent methyltransferase
MHLNTQLLFDRFARSHFTSASRVLEIGPDGFPSTFRREMPASQVWDTADIYKSPQLTYSQTDPCRLPVRDGSYDIVFSANVIEHVPKVWKWFPELARVTRPSGLVITINPTSWPYHEAPIDCWRIYPAGMSALCEEAGLIVESSFSGSLEEPGRRRAIPGRSIEGQPTKTRLAFRLLGLFGFPVEMAFDTITIARKPGPP